MIQIKAVATMDAIRQSIAEAELIQLTIQQRALGAVKVLALSVLLAAVFILVPVLHFFLVPAALIIGVTLAARQMTLKFKLRSTNLRCPKCSQIAEIDGKPFQWPKRVTCQSCHSALLLRPISQSDQ